MTIRPLAAFGLAAVLTVPGATPATAKPAAPLEAAFKQARPRLTLLGAPTDEPSCGGTHLNVYLRGGEAVCLDWTIEMSNRYVRQQFYLAGMTPRLAVETIYTKLNGQADLLPRPRLQSKRRYDLGAGEPGPHARELLDHEQALLRFFREHRRDFTGGAVDND